MSLDKSPAPEGGIKPLAVSVKTTAKLIDSGVSTVWLMLKDGRLKGTTVGRSRRVFYSSIEELLGLRKAA